MNINGINSSATGSAFTAVSSAYITATPAATQTANSESADSQDSQDTVSISNTGRAALSADVGAAFRDKASDKNNDVDDASSAQPMTLIDEQIKKIKEQIKALQEMLAKLENDDSEAAEQQRKMIQDQIMQLTSQVVSLNEQKMREAQKASA